MWEVLLSPEVQDFIRKQDHQISERLRKGLSKLKTDYPFHFLEHFESHGGYYKFRIGEYRALIDVDFAKKQLIVRVLDHRSVVYKR